MDIAELRRKAREGKPGEDKSISSAAEPVSEPPESEGSAPAFPEPPAGVPTEAADHGVQLDWADEALEKLFSGEDSLALVAADQDHALTFLEAQEGGQQYLAFHLDREEYGLDIRTISEIIKVKEFTDVPRVPDFVLGIISLRGVIVPVYDLSMRLRLGGSRLTANSRIIVCQSGDLSVGLLVDDITQVITLGDEKIEPPPAVLSGLDKDCMTGVGRFQGRMIILLNVENVLNVELTDTKERMRE